MLLYAETHYPRFGPSRIRKSEPELAADVPWRVEPGTGIPVLLVVKDAHWYPVFLERLTLIVEDAGTGSDVATIEHVLNERVTSIWWWHLVEIPSLPSGTYRVSPVLTYRCGDAWHSVVADNYRGTSHRPFTVSVGGERWPIPEGWQAGDVHTHTEYTRDQVEFGPPLPAIAAMSRSMGVRWVALTDHSYDLDDSEQDYLVDAPELPRWKAFLRGCSEPHEEVCLIPGEEVSCGNRKGRNVHLLGLGLSQYIPGKGDSAERPTRTRPDLAVPEVIRRIRDQDGLAIAAHPGHRSPLAERIIFRRGTWEWDDLTEPGLGGMQFWNGPRDRGFERGLEAWVRLLLSGRRMVGLAGNDSHGAFGRSRRVRLPWVSLADDERHLFGRVRTVVGTEKGTPQAVLAALAEGRCYLTDGPALTLEVATAAGRFPLGSTAPVPVMRAIIAASSTSDWGAIERVGLAVGIIGERGERWTWQGVSGDLFSVTWEPAIDVKQAAYVRAEVRTKDGACAFTNPIWISGAR